MEYRDSPSNKPNHDPLEYLSLFVQCPRVAYGKLSFGLASEFGKQHAETLL